LFVAIHANDLERMHVIKRDGRKETVKFDKITARINRLSYGLSQEFIDVAKIAQKVTMPT